MAVSGKLCVSLIEARNILSADMSSELSFYVKLRLGHSEVKTDTCYNNITPKFLKDLRLSVPSPEFDVLRIEMLQLGLKGDLVIGTTELRVLSLVNKGTVVQWLDLKAFNQSVGAQLCCVLRYLSARATKAPAPFNILCTAEANRPMTPSYAIATREAREKAVSAAPAPAVARSLFSDIVDGRPAADPGVVMPTTPAQPVPASSAAQPSPALQPSSPTLSRYPQHQVGAGAADANHAASANGGAPPEPDPEAAPQVVAHPQEEPSPSDPPAPTAVASKEGVRRSHGKHGQLPLPLAMASGMLAGALVYLLKRPPVEGTNRDDETCLISSCFNKSTYEQYRRRVEALEGGWAK